MADKVFRLVKQFIQALDNAQYTDNTSIGWSGQVTEYTVSNWDDVKALDKANIQTKAALYGLEEYP